MMHQVVVMYFIQHYLCPLLFICNFILDANVDIAGPDDEEEEEFFEAEPLPILGRCKALYTFEGTFHTISTISFHE